MYHAPVTLDPDQHDPDSGDVLEDPVVTLVGLPRADREGEQLQGLIEDAVDEVLDSLPKAKRRDGGLVREAVRRGVRGNVDVAWGKKPAVIVHVVHVSD